MAFKSVKAWLSLLSFGGNGDMQKQLGDAIF